jgi:hypothetical protein
VVPDRIGLEDDQEAIRAAVRNDLQAQSALPVRIAATGNPGGMTDDQPALGTDSAQNATTVLRETVEIGLGALSGMTGIAALEIPGPGTMRQDMTIPLWMTMSPPRNSNAPPGESSKRSPRKTRSGSPVIW